MMMARCLRVAAAAGLVALRDEVGAGGLAALAVLRLDVVDRGAVGAVEPLGIGVEHVVGLLGRRVRTAYGRVVGPRPRPALACLRAVLREGVLAGGVVDLDPRLHVEAVDVEAHARAAVLDRPRFHLHAARHELVALEDGRHAVEHVVVGLLDVVGHLVLEGEHPLDVEVAGARDEVALVGVLAGELVSDEVAAVVEVRAVDEVVLGDLPARGLDLADGAALLGRHGLFAHEGGVGAAAAEVVEGCVVLEGLILCFLLVGERGLASVDLDVRLAFVGRELVGGKLRDGAVRVACGLRVARGLRASRQSRQRHGQRDCDDQAPECLRATDRAGLGHRGSFGSWRAACNGHRSRWCCACLVVVS